jgi:hypothetical protein
MPINYEPTKSFCYRFARYELLDEIALEQEAVSGEPFRMLDVSKRVIERHLTPEQLNVQIPAAEANRMDSIYGTIKFFVALHAKRLPNSPFLWLGQGGMYRLKSEIDIQHEMEETELEAEDDDEENQLQDGWIYAFSFPVLVKNNIAFPIKIGKTIQDVESRVSAQCKGSASFENPVILGKWQVKRYGTVESAIHDTLKSRGKWRENAPGTEWFDTTIEEIIKILKFITEEYS